jgi:hypothetical protein
VNPGDTVSITPLVSDITEGTGLSFTSYSCIDYGIALGAEPTCTGNPTRIALSSGTITSIVLPNAFTGLATPINVVVPDAQTILGLRVPVQQYNGVSYIFEYLLQNSRGESVRSFKRILVSATSKAIKNANPSVGDMLFNGVSVGTGSLPIATEVSASLAYTGVPAETFQKMNSAGELSGAIEELITTWFVTDGKLNSQRTLDFGSNIFKGPDVAPIGRPAFLIGIVRDGRGGIGQITKCFGICN